MRPTVFLSAITLMAGPLASAPAFAQAVPQQSSAAAKPAANPNDVVCEKQEETGSRLVAHRVCKTRAQWAEDRRLDRQVIDLVQTQRGCKDGQGC